MGRKKATTAENAILEVEAIEMDGKQETAEPAGNSDYSTMTKSAVIRLADGKHPGKSDAELEAVIKEQYGRNDITADYIYQRRNAAKRKQQRSKPTKRQEKPDSGLPSFDVLRQFKTALGRDRLVELIDLIGE